MPTKYTSKKEFLEALLNAIGDYERGEKKEEGKKERGIVEKLRDIHLFSVAGTVGGLVCAGLLTKCFYLNGYNSLPDVFSQYYSSIPIINTTINTISGIYTTGVIVGSNIITGGCLLAGGYSLGNSIEDKILENSTHTS